MKAQDVLAYSFGAIRLRKLRAGLTTLGVVIGIAAIVALLSITQGLQETITRQLQTGFATDTLIVSPGGGFGSAAQGGVSVGDSGFKLLVGDIQIINNIENVETSIAVIQKVGNITVKGSSRLVSLVGVDFAEYAGVYSSTFVAESGEIPSSPSNDTMIVGKRVSDPWDNATLFCKTNDTAEILWLNATARPPKYENYSGPITAVLKEIGGLSIGGPSDYGVYMPLTQAETFFGTDECSMIIVKLKNDDKATIENASKAIEEKFDKQVSVVSATAILDILSSVFSIIELFLGGIAAISLLVAGIGIMNIMIVSLMERTREIGILKALGMKSRTVLLVFLCESVIIGLIGAVIGVASGWILANVVAIAFRGGGRVTMGTGNQAATTGGMTITPVLTPMVTLLALAFGVGISAIFALYPAWRASKLKPVEALRYE